jgi:hypothetical protein
MSSKNTRWRTKYKTLKKVCEAINKENIQKEIQTWKKSSENTENRIRL